jgi:hypothetical protein
MLTLASTITLCSLLLGPGDLPTTALGVPSPQVLNEVRDTIEAQAPPADEAAPPAQAAEPAPASEPASATKREWMLVIAPGFDYIRGPSLNPYRAIGGGFRFGGHAILWAGKKGHFLVGGGPILQYSYVKDQFGDSIHLVTINGDLLLGGGNKRFGIYWHLSAGPGYLEAHDGQTNTRVRTFGARAATGLGGFAKVHDRFSIGALVDFGWAGGVWVNALLTANIHFGRRGDPL